MRTWISFLFIFNKLHGTSINAPEGYIVIEKLVWCYRAPAMTGFQEGWNPLWAYCKQPYCAFTRG